MPHLEEEDRLQPEPGHYECINVLKDANDRLNEEPQDLNCDPLFRKSHAQSGRLVFGRLSKEARGGQRSTEEADPPEVVVLQARLHSRPDRHYLVMEDQVNQSKRSRKEKKKSHKKIKQQSRKSDEKEIEVLNDTVKNDGRMIASKVLPIMAMLLQKNDHQEGEGSDEAKVTEHPPEEVVQKKPVQPRLSVQCIQLLPSEPTNSKRI